MSKTALVTYESVSAAAAALEHEGKNPSVRAVMSALGGGSPNAIGPLLAKWKNDRPLVEARKKIVVDERIVDLIAEQIQKNVRDAVAHAEIEASEFKDDYELISKTGLELEAKVESLESQVHDFIEELKQNEITISDLNKTIDELKISSSDEIEKANEAANVERAKSDALIAKISALEAKLEDRNNDLIERKNELVEQKKEISILQSSAMQSASQNATIVAQNEALKNVNAELTARLKEIEKRFEMAESQNRELSQKLLESSSQNATIIAQNEAMKDVKSELTARLKEIEKRFEMAESQNRELSSKLMASAAAKKSS